VSIKAIIARPEVILACVPLGEVGLELLLRFLFRSSTLDSIKFAGRVDDRALFKNLATNDTAAKGLAAYIDNNSDVERCYEILVFATLSLIVWGLSSRAVCKEEYIYVCYVLLWGLLAVTLLVLLSRFLPARKKKDEFAVEGGTKRYFYAALVLNILVIAFEIVTKDYLCAPH
jgi:hypothetical protein